MCKAPTTKVRGEYRGGQGAAESARRGQIDHDETQEAAAIAVTGDG